MIEKVLMPFQTESFNADHFVNAEFLKLKQRFSIKTAIESGTAYGYTTLWLAANFDKVYTIEISKEFCDVARSKFLLHPNITSIHGNSEDIISHLKIEGNSIWFLDAHGFGSAKQCPLLGELYAISKLNIKPVICVHDFFVPDSELGYDAYNGQPFNIEWIGKSLDKIYGGIDDWEFHYNSDETATGARRGIIYIYPV